MRGGLGAIDQDARADRARTAHDFGDRVDVAKDVGHMADRHQARARSERPFELAQVQLAIVVDAKHLDRAPVRSAMARHGQPIRIMLGDRDDDLVAGLQVGRSP